MNTHEYMRSYFIESALGGVTALPYDLTSESDVEFLTIAGRRIPKSMAASKNFKLNEDEDDPPISNDRLREIMLYKMPPYELKIKNMLSYNATLTSNSSNVELRVLLQYSTKKADLRSLYLSERGKHIAKQFFSNLLYVLDYVGITKISLNAVDVGTYAWSKYGFNADQSVINEFYSGLKYLVNNDMRFIPSSLSSMRELASIVISRSQIMEFVTSMRSSDLWLEVSRVEEPGVGLYYTPDGSFLLGKYFLISCGKNLIPDCDSGWWGNLDLNDPSSRSLLVSYIKYAEKRPVM